MMCIAKILSVDLEGEIIAVQEDNTSVGHTYQTSLALLAGVDPIRSCFPVTSNSF
jgi:hypothetical protein